MGREDTTYLPILDTAIARSRSILQEYRLLYLRSIYLYYNGKVAEAFREMNNLIIRTMTARDYLRMLGMWSLQSGSPELAVDYFEQAGFGNDAEYDFYSLIACLGSGNLGKADTLCDIIDPGKDSDLLEEIAGIKKILQLDHYNPEGITEVEKYQIIKYRSDLFNSEKDIQDFLRAMNNPLIRDLSYLEIAEQYFNYGDIAKASYYLDLMSSDDTGNAELYLRRQHLEMKILKKKGDFTQLASAVEKYKGISNDNDALLPFEARLYENHGDTVEAQKIFNRLAKYDPFNADAIIDAAEYFNKRVPDQYFAYKLYIKALEIN